MDTNSRIGAFSLSRMDAQWTRACTHKHALPMPDKASVRFAPEIGYWRGTKARTLWATAGITLVSRATLETPNATPSCEVLLKSRQPLGSLSRAMKTLDNHANACRKLLLGVESLAMCVQEGLARHGC